MNMCLLHRAILFIPSLVLHPVIAQEPPFSVRGAGQILTVPAAQSSETQAVESLSALGHFFDVEVDEKMLGTLWQVQSANDEWSKLTATSRAANLPFVMQRLRGGELDRLGPLLARLKGPSQTVIVQAISKDNMLLFVNGQDALMKRREFERRFAGEVLGVASRSALRIEEPVREIKLRSIGGNGEIVQTVRLRNTSDRPLPIRVASTSCGCTGATVSPAVLAPGGNGVLTAKMHATDSRLVTINLQSGDVQAPAVVPWAVVALQTRAPQIDLPPSMLLNSAKGEAASALVTVHLPRGSHLARVWVREPWLSASIRSTAASASSNKKEVEVQVKMSDKAPAGRFESEVHLQLRNSEAEEIVVPVAGIVSDDIVAHPPSLSLGTHVKGAEVRKTILVRGPRLFSIPSFEASERVSVKADPKVVARVHAVEIVTRINSEEGAQNERVILRLSDGRFLNVDIFANVTRMPSTPIIQVDDIAVGSTAPNFELRDHRGVLRRLSDLRGRRALLLTFFPRCFSGGCAQQLASLQREKSSFERAGIEVWAVSTDGMEGVVGVKSFAQTLKLSFPLLSDASRKVCTLYGAATSLDDLARRQSVFIDKAGVVRLIDRDMKVTTHGRDVLISLQEQGLLP